MRSIVSFFLSIALVSGSLWASTLDKAESAYGEGRFEEASKFYLEHALAKTASSPNASVFHNLGLSFDRQKESGLAVAAFLRAVQLEPRQADFQYNLNFLLTKTSDKLSPDFPVSVGETFWAGPSPYLSERELFYSALFFLLLLSGFASYAILRTQGRSMSIAAAWISAVLLLISLSGLSYKFFGENDVGAVAVPRLDAYSGPTESVVIFELHEGAPFQILNSSGDFIKVGLSDLKQGWVRKEGVASFGRERFILPKALESHVMN